MSLVSSKKFRICDHCGIPLTSINRYIMRSSYRFSGTFAHESKFDLCSACCLRYKEIVESFIKSGKEHHTSKIKALEAYQKEMEEHETQKIEGVSKHD